jgi:hypothetical protein
LTPFESPAARRKLLRLTGMNCPCVSGLRYWTIRDLARKLQQISALWQSRRLPKLEKFESKML